MSKFHLIPYYTDMNIVDSEEQHNVGYFDDVFTVDEHKQLLKDSEIVDPIIFTKIRSQFHKTRLQDKCAIICTFGCYAPFHDGHTYSIKAAIDLVSKTHFVLGTIIYPAHDEYVSTKPGMTEEILNKRKHYDYWKNDFNMFMDDFVMQQKGDVNFPYLLHRTRKYANIIQRYLNNGIDNVDVFFIVGEDNAGFADVHDINTIPIIVERNGKLSKEHLLKHYPHAKFIFDSPYKDYSSTKERTK